MAFLALGLAPLFLAGCGNQYRPVVSSVNPVGPAAQPEKFAVAISNTTTTGSTAITAPTSECAVAASTGTPGLVNLIDFSGDDLLTTVSVGVNPCYLQLDAGGDTGYTLNGDGTTNSFGITTSLIQSQVNQTTLPAGPGGTSPMPVAILPQTTNLYIAESALNAVAQLTQTSPPAFKQNLITGQNTVYTVGVASAPRVYAISQGASGSVGTVAAIETNSNTISSTIPVGRGPVYGVMTPDSRRAFILNKTDGTVSVINSQTNALDTFTNVATGTVTSTISVGAAPVWADFAPPLTEMVVANQGNGTTPGSVSIISIPLCTASTVTSNPNCDPANPVDATGFGQVVATIPVGINPVMVAVLQDGSQAFVANQGNATTPGSISVINLATDRVVATVPAGASTNELDSIVHGHPTWIAVTTGTPTGKVYVTSSDSTDLTIIRTDNDTVQTHLTLQGTGIAVRVSAP
jgi:YVTN family beta-propeller protein